MVQGWIQIAIFVAVVIALTPLLGSYMARVYEGGQPVLLERVLGPFERLLYRVLRVDPGKLRSRARNQHIAFQRQTAMYLARKISAATFPAIAAAFRAGSFDRGLGLPGHRGPNRS